MSQAAQGIVVGLILFAIAFAWAMGVRSVLVTKPQSRKNVRYEDLATTAYVDVLGRPAAIVDLAEVAPYVEGSTVMVTGAGGSIGSELCRQLVKLAPRRLLLLGHGENSLYEIEYELRTRWSFSRTETILADVADVTRIRAAFTRYRPSIVLHAAAHKHVPILENNVCEAVRNNVIGTRVLALASAAAGVSKFLMVSTDKAVNPSSVLGATKRAAEMVVQSFEGHSATQFVAVRFGNVLGSRGSVVRLFGRQIEQGGPATITHREMQRYFMTIPEAASLILKASAIGRDGQVCVLDMGKPVKILSLAEAMIRAAGKVPYRDIEIIETGIRPGEKLDEELFTAGESLSATTADRIFIAEQERIPYQVLALKLARLERALACDDPAGAMQCVGDIIVRQDCLMPPQWPRAEGRLSLTL